MNDKVRDLSLHQCPGTNSACSDDISGRTSSVKTVVRHASKDLSDSQPEVSASIQIAVSEATCSVDDLARCLHVLVYRQTSDMTLPLRLLQFVYVLAMLLGTALTSFACAYEDNLNCRKTISHVNINNKTCKKQDKATHAAVAANTSVLLALAKVIKQKEKTKFKAAMTAIRVDTDCTAHRIAIEAIGNSGAIRLVTIDVRFTRIESSYPASGLMREGFLSIKRPMDPSYQFRTLPVTNRANGSSTCRARKVTRSLACDPLY